MIETGAVEAELDWLEAELAAAWPAVAATSRAALAGWRRALTADGGGWDTSRLTGDGFPLELVWRPAAATPGWTVEVGGPGLTAVVRLARAARLAAVAPTTVAALQAMQAVAAARLTFGAWLGVRPRTDGVDHKLYVEVPPGAAARAAALVGDALGTAPILTTRAARLRLLGHRPDDGSWEAYHRVDALTGWELERVAQRAGLPGAAAPLLELVGAVLGRPVAEALPGRQHGVSLARVGDRMVLTVFLFARVLGGDVRIRRRLLEVAATRGWDADGYARLAGGGERDDSRTDHGMLAFAIDDRRTPSLAVGLRVRAPRTGS